MKNLKMKKDMCEILKLLEQTCSQQRSKERKELMEALDDYVNDAKCLSRCLRPLEMMKEKNSLLSADSESLFRVLLQVQYLQADIVGLLLLKIPEHAEDENDGAETFSENLPRLLISQLRWLPFVQDGSNLVTQLLECMKYVVHIIHSTHNTLTLPAKQFSQCMSKTHSKRDCVGDSRDRRRYATVPSRDRFGGTSGE